VFSKILQPTVSGTASATAANARSPDCSATELGQTPLQMELHFRTTKDNTRFTVLLNNMRLMGVFDWLLAVKDFLLTQVQDPWQQQQQQQGKGQGQPHLAVGQADSYANLPDGQPDILLFC
jgi:hypothetical protein